MKPQVSDQLSDEDLDRIERLVNATAPGPWISCVVGRDPQALWNYIELGSCNELGCFAAIEMVGGSVADQDFVASARQDVPRMVRELRILRARLDLLSTDGDHSPLKAIRGMMDGTAALQSASVVTEVHG